MSKYSPELILALQEKATEMRKDIVTMVGCAGCGHPGGSLSAADIVAALYFNVMKHDPKNPKWEGRDRFVLSKGHASPVLYAALANAGYFPREELKTFRSINSRLQGHPDRKKVPGVEFSTGSLGQGLSGANGMALAGKLDKKDYRVFCILGDGESQEGQVWEAAMSAAHFGLDNLIAFTDQNGLQIDGLTCDIMNVEPLADKWRAFNWNVIEIDGHDFSQILDATSDDAKVTGKPRMIVAKTIKGKGVSYMEGVCDWHGKAPSDEQVQKAICELCAG